MTLKAIKELAAAINSPPRAWTPQRLWHAYEILKKDKVRGASDERVLTDIVSLVRFAMPLPPGLVASFSKASERDLKVA